MARVRLVSGLVVLFWLLVVGGIAGPYTGRLAEVQENGNKAFLPASAESTRVAEIEAAFRDSTVIPALVVYERRDGISDADLAAIGRDVDRLRSVVGVAGELSPPIVSEDRRAVQVFWTVPFLMVRGEPVISVPMSVERTAPLAVPAGR